MLNYSEIEHHCFMALFINGIKMKNITLVTKLIAKAMVLLEAKVPSLKENTRIVIFNPKYKKYFLGTIDQVKEDRYIVLYDNKEKFPYMFQSEHLIGKGIEDQYKYSIEENEIWKYVTSYFIKPKPSMLKPKTNKPSKGIDSLKEGDMVILSTPLFKDKKHLFEERIKGYSFGEVKAIDDEGIFIYVFSSRAEFKYSRKDSGIRTVKDIIGKCNATVNDINNKIAEYDIGDYITEFFVEPTIFMKKTSNKQELIDEFMLLFHEEKGDLVTSKGDKTVFYDIGSKGKALTEEEAIKDYGHIIDNPNYDPSAKYGKKTFKKLLVIDEKIVEERQNRLNKDRKQREMLVYSPFTDKLISADDIPNGYVISDELYKDKYPVLRYKGGVGKGYYKDGWGDYQKSDFGYRKGKK